MPEPRRQPAAPLRHWQRRTLVAMRAWERGPFLIAAAPGAGKTRPALAFAAEQLAAGTVRRVVVVCPTVPLTRQWASAAAALGVQLAPDAAQLRPPPDFAGVAVTYARTTTAAARWATQCTADTLVIADEAHHLGEDLAWGQGFRRAFGATGRWLLLSGTPFRSDELSIPGVRYDDGVAVPDISYDYATAVRDGVCRPVSFIPYDGVLQWRSGDDHVEASFEDALVGREAGRRYRTAISVELADGLPRILSEAHARLQRVRAEGHRDAGGLAVTADAEHARAVAGVLRSITGRAPTVVVHTDARASEKLRAFTRATDPWIVAVNMVSEGVDIPRLRVGVYATAARTPLIFRQIVGRFVRTLPGRTVEPSWVYLPADPVLRAHAAEVQRELRHVLRPPGEPADGLSEREPRAVAEPGDADAFVAVAADVAPQLALFGPPAGGAAPARVPVAAPVVAPPPSAYERRALLRDKRHRLVADLRRLEGSGHAEINRWLNRSCGIRRVEEASIDQLERSVELLLGRLTARR